MLRWILGGIAGLTLLLLPACGGGSGASAGGGGTLKVSVTDAPFPSTYVASASVVIEEVRVRNRDQDAWTTVFEGAATIDLVPLTGGVEALLVEAELEPGTYDEVRLVVAAGEVVLTEDAEVAGEDATFTVEDGDLVFPSGSQTGIKVKIGEDGLVVTSGLTAALVLDFDLARNFTLNGTPAHAPGVRRVLFTPVVRAVNASTAGTLAFRVLGAGGAPLADATARLFDALAAPPAEGDPEPVAVLTPNADGEVQAQVAPGVYTMEVEAPLHQTLTVDAITIVLANGTDLGDLVLTPSPGSITGTVSSSETDNPPLAGVTVELRPDGDPAATPVTTTTDAGGVYRFESVAPGTYDLTFTLAGYAPATAEDVVVAAGAEASASPTLSPTP